MVLSLFKPLAKYFIVFKISLQDTFEYRTDFFLNGFKYSMMILMMSTIWLAIGRENPNLEFSQTEIMAYFFFAAMIYGVSNLHTYFFEEDIRLGTLSKYLLRPLSCFWYYFFLQGAAVLVDLLAKVVVMLPLLMLLGFRVEVSMAKIVFLITYLPLVFLFSFNLFMLISTLTFWLTEAWALRWALNIFFRFLSGVLVPISFFPEQFQTILFYLPFQHLAFTPIQVLLGHLSILEASHGLAIMLSWLAAFFLIRLWLWRLGLKSYEGSGL